MTLAIIGFGLLFVPLLGAGFVGVMFFLILGFSLMGMNFGPMGALLPELFPTSVRYTGSAFAYNMSSILGAAVAPFIAIWLWALGEGSPFWVGVYLSVMAVITLVALLLSRETRDIDIEHRPGSRPALDHRWSSLSRPGSVEEQDAQAPGREGQAEKDHRSRRCGSRRRPACAWWWTCRPRSGRAVRRIRRAPPRRRCRPRRRNPGAS